MKSPIMSSKKIELVSEYNHFDLLPLKKYHELNIRIPQTILLDKGFIKDWIFNSHKIPNHPILKKRRENISPFAVVKMFCLKFGYGPVIAGCSNIKQIRNIVKQTLMEQKDYDFVKDKKVIEVTSISNEILSMSLLDFLDYVSQNKYSDQSFYEKWKIIQQKVSFTKINEHYEVESVRHNHLLESKCQKIISVLTTESNIVSTEIENDPYKKSSPSKNFEISQTKNLEGYKFFDTFLNKKFFQMSADLVEFIEKNLKCIVDKVKTKFIINKERQPHLVGIYDLVLKPVKKIVEMREFQICKEKGYLKVEEYNKFLQVYVAENSDSHVVSTPLSQRRGRCKGNFCKIPLEQVQLPPLMQQKLKLPNISANTRLIQSDLREAAIKRKHRIIEKLIENKVIKQNYQIQEQSSQYETSGDNQQMPTVKNKHKQLKICSNCYIFYFHVQRFYEFDIYGNLIERKVLILPNNPDDSAIKEKRLNLKTKSQKLLDPLPHPLHLHPVEQSEKPRTNTSLQAKQRANKRMFTSLNKKSEEERRKIQFRAKSNSKIKLEPIGVNFKKEILEKDNKQDSKAKRMMTLTKLSQPMKLQERSKAKTMHQGLMPLKERRPANQEQAIEQIVKKFGGLPDSSRQQLIFYAKKYYKDNLPQPIDRRSFSSYYEPHLYQFMSTSPISIHPKRRIKKRPEMSLTRLSQITDYPQIVSKSQFIFDTIIINQQTTIPFCIITTKVVNPDNLVSGQTFQNIFIVHDLFDSFIEHISLAKELLEQDEVLNKRIILFNYPGQSHTIYNRGNFDGFSAYFGEVFDKLIFRLSNQKSELKIIDLQKDSFKFLGIGFGGYLISHFIGSYSQTFNRIANVMLINSFMQFPSQYKSMLKSLLELFQTSKTDPTIEPQAFLYYNKAIHSEEIDQEELEHKSGLNPIRVEDRVYILRSILNELQESQTAAYSIEPTFFEEFKQCQVSIIYGRNNAIIPKKSCLELLYYRNNPKQEIEGRVFVEIEGGHDIFADNYDDIFRILIMFLKR